MSIGAKGRADRRQRYLVEQWPEYRPSLDDTTGVPEPQAAAALPQQLCAGVTDDNVLARRGTPELLRDWSTIMRGCAAATSSEQTTTPLEISPRRSSRSTTRASAARLARPAGMSRPPTTSAFKSKPCARPRTPNDATSARYATATTTSSWWSCSTKTSSLPEGAVHHARGGRGALPHRAHVNRRVIIVTQTLRQDSRVQHLDLTAAARR